MKRIGIFLPVLDLNFEVYKRYIFSIYLPGLYFISGIFLVEFKFLNKYSIEIN